MKTSAERIKNLTDTLGRLIEQERKAFKRLIESSPQDGSPLQQVERLTDLIRRLEERFDLLARMANDDFLGKMRNEAELLAPALADSRAGAVLTSLVELEQPSLNVLCELLLDRLIEATQAERGFILFYNPESTEAEVIAARNFQTRNLSLAEYNFSRSLLREAFGRENTLLVEDASSDPAFSHELSVRRFQIRSVLVVPMKYEGRTAGALYLENNRLASIFSDEEARLVERVVRFAVFLLSSARMLPVVFESDAAVLLEDRHITTEMKGSDPKILALLNAASRIADSPATVLIEGESGTGKELVARALHFGSPRKDRPFVAINCAAIPESLLESELFGHERGAFTGASERYIGHIEQGNGGTIFLDEVSELAYSLQAKLLRFLQSHEFRRLGGKETMQVNVRVVAATSKDLREMTTRGKFQEALYYRLNVVPLRVPALRERKHDIPLLVDYFVGKFSEIYCKKVQVDRDVYGWLAEYQFPGNVRELENLSHRLVALSPDGFIRSGDLPREILQAATTRLGLEKEPFYITLNTPPQDLEELRRRKEEIRRLLAIQERQLAERIIKENDGNLTRAAAKLGVHRITLHKMLKKSEKEPTDPD